MSSIEEKFIAALQELGPQSPEQCVALGLVRSIRALSKVVEASEGRIVMVDGRLSLPGQSADEFLNDAPVSLGRYVIVDLETTSADAERAEILELAAIRVEDGQETAHFVRLISGVPLPREVGELTGITLQELEEHGVPLQQALGDFTAWLADDAVLAHNGKNYDFSVLKRELERCGLALGSRPQLDSLLLAPLAFIGDEQPPEVYQLGSLHALVTGKVHDSAHRALDDCRATLAVVNACISRLLGIGGGLRSLLELLPIPEFRLAWPQANAEAAAFEGLAYQWLSAQAARTHIRETGGRSAASWSEMLPNPRPGQEQMLDEVQRTLRGGGLSVIEAPTGTGKTRGYLLPALLEGRPGAPVVVSTHTRQLQNQILDEALAVQRAGFNLNVLTIKGQTNYICPDRFANWLINKLDAESGQVVMPPGEARAAALLLLRHQDGEFEHLPPTPLRFSGEYRRLQQTVSTIRARCSDSCRFHGSCAYFPLHQARSEAQVIVINHALLFRSLIQEKDDLEGIPLNRVVVDEAHDLSEAAQAALRREVSVQSLRALLNELLEQRPRRLGTEGARMGQELIRRLTPYAEQHLSGQALMAELRVIHGEAPQAPDRLLKPVQDWLARQSDVPKKVQDAWNGWKSKVVSEQGFLAGAERQAAEHRTFDVLARLRTLPSKLADVRQDLDRWQRHLRTFAMQYGSGNSQFGYTAAVTPALATAREFREVREVGQQLLPRLALLASALRDLNALPALRAEVEILAGRLDAAHEALKGLLGRDPGDDVYAVSAGDEEGSLWSVPLWLHSRLAPLWATLNSTVLTSATLRIPDSERAEGEGDVADFGLFQKELGLPPGRFLALAPTLPYQLGKVLLTSYMPLIRHPDFARMAGQELSSLAPQLPHRSLHIFTARARQKGASEMMRRAGTAHLSSVDDGAARVVRELAAQSTGTALGSSGFMQGVDLPDLSMVSLDRLPFPIPDVVLTQQRVALGNFERFWNTIYLPRAVLKFVQAFGRLIRDSRERSGPGAFVLWDKRLPVSYYQSRFLAALPVPASNILRPGSREAFYQALEKLYGQPFTPGPLKTAKEEILLICA